MQVTLRTLDLQRTMRRAGWRCPKSARRFRTIPAGYTTLRSMRKIVLLASLFFPLAATAGDAITAIRFGQIIDGKGKTWTNASVVLEAERVKSLGAEAPAGAAGI